MLQEYMPLILTLASNAQGVSESVAQKDLPLEVRIGLAVGGAILILIAIVIGIVKHRRGCYGE